MLNAERLRLNEEGLGLMLNLKTEKPSCYAHDGFQTLYAGFKLKLTAF